jgi:hypothetical protein
MSEPWKYIRHGQQNKRYNNKLDPTQIDIYKRWDTIYNGFFADKKELVVLLFEAFKALAPHWGYEVENTNF